MTRLRPLSVVGFLLPFLPALNIAGGFDVASLRVLVLLWFACWMVRRVIRQEPLLPAQPPIILLTMLVALGVFSLVWTNNIEFTLRKSAYFVSLLPVAWMVASFSKEKQKQLLHGVFIGAAASAGLALTIFLSQFIFDATAVVGVLSSLAPVLFGESTAQAVGAFPSWYVATGSGPLLRAFFPFPNPHTAVLFWSFGLTLTLGYRRYLLAALLSITTLLSFSRGGAVVFIGIITFWVVWMLLFGSGAQRKVKISPLTYSTIIVLVFLCIVSAPLLLERTATLTNLQEGSTSERLELWDDAYAVAKTAPVLGVGLGGFAAALDPLASYRVPTNAHNMYLEVLAELGVLGLLFFVGVLVVSVWVVFRERKTDSQRAPMLLAGILAFSIHAVFETNMYSPANLFVLFVFLAVAATLPLQESYKKT